MARKPNYGFEKRKKEQDRKAKKDLKRADRLQRREEQRLGDDGEATNALSVTDDGPSEDNPSQP